MGGTNFNGQLGAPGQFKERSPCMINQLLQPTISNLWAWLAWEPLNCSYISLLLLLCDVAQVFCFWPMTRMCVLSLWRLWSPPLWPVLCLPPLVLLFCPPMPNEQWTQVVLNSEHVIGGEENFGAKFDDVVALLKKIDQKLSKRQRPQAFPVVTKCL